MHDRIRRALEISRSGFTDIRVEQEWRTHVEYRGQNLENLEASTELGGAESTGNGFRSDGMLKQDFELQPGVAPATSQIPVGSQSLEQILGGLDEALLVYEVIGLGQGNILAGEFSNNVSLGFLVHRGEIVGRVKNTMIAGNVYDLLSDKLVGLSDHAERVWGMLNTPAIAIDSVGGASRS